MYATLCTGSTVELLQSRLKLSERGRAIGSGRWNTKWRRCSKVCV